MAKPPQCISYQPFQPIPCRCVWSWTKPLNVACHKLNETKHLTLGGGPNSLSLLNRWGGSPSTAAGGGGARLVHHPQGPQRHLPQDQQNTRAEQCWGPAEDSHQGASVNCVILLIPCSCVPVLCVCVCVWEKLYICEMCYVWCLFYSFIELRSE